MNKNETAKIIALIKLNYPHIYQDYSDSDLDLLISEWTLQLEQMPYKAIYVAVQCHISTNPYPPTIAHIQGILYDMSNSKLPSGEEAWAIVLKAGRASLYPDSAYEELKKLPEYLKPIVTFDLLQSIANSSDADLPFIKKDFLQDYRSVTESHKRNVQISSISNNIRKLTSEEYGSDSADADVRLLEDKDDEREKP